MLQNICIALLVGASTVSSQVTLLPGKDEPKPGDPNALDSILECGDNTDAILAIPEVSNAVFTMRQNVVVAINTRDDSCEAKGDDSICSLDYATVDNSNYKALCEANNGVYDENAHSVTCNSRDPSIVGRVIYQFFNYPTCFASTCEESDRERWIADEIDTYELSVERNTNWLCDSDYEIEVTQPPVEPTVAAGSCPNTSKNTVESCGPLGNRLQDQMCDCYSFCDGELVGCENVGDDPKALETFCAGDLIMGCTNDLFFEYNNFRASGSGVGYSKAATVVAVALGWLTLSMN